MVYHQSLVYVRVSSLVPAHSEGGIEDMFQVDGEEVEEALRASSGDSVTGVVHICPGICSLGETTVC